ncbi:MAG: hypothetical protein AB9M60_01950 [Leptothrix sp. (in: b-proteobacteria)]
MKKVLVLAAAVAGVAGWSAPVSAQESLAEQQVYALEGLGGKQPSFRRAHAKGLCASGDVTDNANARAQSSAAVFSGDKVPVIARSLIGGGNPMGMAPSAGPELNAHAAAHGESCGRRLSEMAN